MIRRTALVALAVAVALGTSTPAHASIKRIGKCSARGNYATCVASGSVNHPHALFVKVASRPRQRVAVYWSTVCSRGYGAGSKSGSFKARTPVRRQVKMAYAAPDDCTMSASAQLTHKGGLRVKLLARV